MTRKTAGSCETVFSNATSRTPADTKVYDRYKALRAILFDSDSGPQMNNQNDGKKEVDIVIKFVVGVVVDAPLLPQLTPSASMYHKNKMDIVDTAVSKGSFKTLVAAVKAAGLAGTLKGKGPLQFLRRRMLLLQSD